jgi:hypothetical protein
MVHFITVSSKFYAGFFVAQTIKIMYVFVNVVQIYWLIERPIDLQKVEICFCVLNEPNE